MSRSRGRLAWTEPLVQLHFPPIDVMTHVVTADSNLHWFAILGTILQVFLSTNGQMIQEKLGPTGEKDFKYLKRVPYETLAFK